MGSWNVLNGFGFDVLPVSDCGLTPWHNVTLALVAPKEKIRVLHLSLDPKMLETAFVRPPMNGF